MKFLLMWENREVLGNGKIDITNEEIICNSDKEIAEIIDGVLFDKFPVNPNFKVYTLVDTTDKFANVTQKMNNPKRLQQQRQDYQRWLMSLKKATVKFA